MLSRLLLLIVLSRFLEPSEVGLFGLFMATVMLGWYLLGGDFYTYSNRDLVRRPSTEWSFVIQHSVCAHGVLYLVLLPPLALLFYFGVLPPALVWWFLGILIVEHLAQELNRLLNFMGRPLISGIVMFIRRGLWAYVVPAVMWWLPETRTLTTVFLFWLVGGVLAVVIATIIVYRNVPDWRRWPLDCAWIMQGFRVGGVFLLSTLALRGLTTLDRYIVRDLAGPDLLGVYVLYIGFAMSIMTLLEPAVLAFLNPRLVTAYHQGNYSRYRRTLTELAWSTFGLSVFFALLVSVAAPWVFAWTERMVYAAHLPLLWLLLATAVVYAASLAPHSGLYAQGRDRSILGANLSSLPVFAVVTLGLAAEAPLYATAWGLLAAFAWMGVAKTMACWFRVT